MKVSIGAGGLNNLRLNSSQSHVTTVRWSQDTIEILRKGSFDSRKTSWREFVRLGTAIIIPIVRAKDWMSI